MSGPGPGRPGAARRRDGWAVAETAPWITKTLREEEDETTAQIAKGGLTVTPANMADVAPAAKLLAPYWDQWAKQKGGEASEALAKVRAALGR